MPFFAGAPRDEAVLGEVPNGTHILVKGIATIGEPQPSTAVQRSIFFRGPHENARTSRDVTDGATEDGFGSMGIR